MKTRPILFSGEMVRALLDGRKTQTHRVLKGFPDVDPKFTPYQFQSSGQWSLQWRDKHERILDYTAMTKCPYGVPGDRLWVRETFAFPENIDGCPPRHVDAEWAKEYPGHTRYRATDERINSQGRWRPSIHMPRWASRITLEVLSVRVERVQSIRDSDAIAEGVEWSGLADKTGLTVGAPTRAFEALWNTINAKRGYGWEANPWAWVVGFKVVG